MDASRVRLFPTRCPRDQPARNSFQWNHSSVKLPMQFRPAASLEIGGEGGPISLSRRQTYTLLKQQMEVAAKSEDYKKAATLRDSLRSFEEREPVFRLQRMLKAAIKDERFEDAAKLRDELQILTSSALSKCSSVATTQGIHVQVRSVYMEGRSHPTKNRFLYAYRIRINNNTERSVQLLKRHWIITDAYGKTEHVWGMGVVGEQPVILPKTMFEYSSTLLLGTHSGTMEGEFEMKHLDRMNLETFNVSMAPFNLSTDSYDDDEIESFSGF